MGGYGLHLVQRGRFEVLRSVGMPSSVVVFDQDLLLVDGDPGLEVSKLLLGVVGEFLVRSAARRDLDRRLEAIDKCGAKVAVEEALSAAGNGRIVAVDEIEYFRIGPGIRRKRLEFGLQGGKIKIRVDPAQSPIRLISELLLPLLGDRLIVSGSFEHP